MSDSDDVRPTIGEEKILDHGYVRLLDYMGNDYSILQAARASTGGAPKKSDRADRGLIRYLFRNEHTSPFEQAVLKFEILMPIFDARQIMRHRTWAFNEFSSRYAEMIEDLFVPGTFRAQGVKNHQGSGADIDPALNAQLKSELSELYKQDREFYKKLIDLGVAREQARFHMPVGNYTLVFGTVSLHNLFRFLRLRVHEHAQYETRVIADAMLKLIKEHTPFKWAIEAFEDFVKIDWALQTLKNLFDVDTREGYKDVDLLLGHMNSLIEYRTKIVDDFNEARKKQETK